MIVLGIDQAAVSGWCIARRGIGRPEIIAHGIATKATERRDIIARALLSCDVTRGEKMAAVYEAHTTGGGDRWNPATMIGIGDSRGRWMEALELAGVPRRLCIGVPPHTWRAAMIGRHRMKREQWKAAAVLSCRGRGVEVASDDEAEAVLIAMWGAQCCAEIAKIAGRE